jgi:VanZ family protein
MADDRYEHFAAHFIAGGLLAISCSHPLQLLSNGVVLTICAGALEIIQSWIPNRTSSARDFATSTFGAWLAIVLIGVVRWARDSIAAASPK